MHSTFMGVNIWHADRNSSGIRWECTIAGQRFRADTLAGIRDAIRNERARWGAYWNEAR